MPLAITEQKDVQQKTSLFFLNKKELKPHWCPLRDLSEKKSKVEYHGNGCFGINEAMKNSFNLGFNACIDEILKGANWDE